MNDIKSTNQSPEKLPLRKALWWILISVVVITGSSILAFFFYRHYIDRQKSDAAYQIVAVVQTSQDAEGLKTVYLAELLNLSIDRPKNLFSFNAKEAQEKLLQSPVIKEATVRKIRPGTIHVDYILRKPIAFLGDYSNTAIDADGVTFPFKPFYTPKRLPEIYLGDEDKDDNCSKNFVWGEAVDGRRIDLAFNVLDLLTENYNDELSTIVRIDVSKAFAPSYGQRQIVVEFEDRLPRLIDGRPILSIHPRILRLAAENYVQQLANYLNLRAYLRQQDKLLPITADGGTKVQSKATLIDLRLSELAFINKEQ